MNAKIKINPLVTEDLKGIKNYISEDNLDVAIKTVKEIIEKIDSLAQFPEMGKLLTYKIKLKSKYRYIICNKYLIFYIFEKDTVYIQRILHGKMDYMSLLNEQ